jgi:cold shock CspA family protein
MEKITERVSVKVSYDGVEVKPPDDGYLGQLRPGSILLEIYVAAGRDYICALDVNAKKNINFKKDHSTDPVEGSMFLTNIRIKTGDDGVYHTEYPNNNCRIMRIYKNGHVEMWEIAVISQNGNFFLTTQKTYNVNCYNNEGKLDCPKFSKWPQVLNLLFSSLYYKNLPLISEYQEEKMIRPGELPKEIGHVQWWNIAQGFGAIMTPNGPARVHWKNIFPSNGDRFARLNAGGRVRYQKLITPNQTKARSTNFRLEAVGVKTIT